VTTDWRVDGWMRRLLLCVALCPLLTVNLVLLLVDYESERNYFVFTRIWAERQLACVGTPCVLDLGLCDESAAGSLPIAIVVDSASASSYVQRHHAMHARG
jgi:hypothetical protein